MTAQHGSPDAVRPNEPPAALAKVRDLADRAADAYSSTGWLRAGAAAIPFIGGSIDALITTRASELFERRVTAFLEELQAAAARLEETKVDRRYLDSEDWHDLLLRAFRAAADTRDPEKVRLYAAILIGAAKVDGMPGLDPEAILASVADLSPAEIGLARVMYANETAPGDLSTMERWERTLADPPANVRDDVTFHLKRIERTGLIAEETGTLWGYSGGAYFVTPTFRRLMEFIESRELGERDTSSS